MSRESCSPAEEGRAPRVPSELVRRSGAGVEQGSAEGSPGTVGEQACGLGEWALDAMLTQGRFGERRTVAVLGSGP